MGLFMLRLLNNVLVVFKIVSICVNDCKETTLVFQANETNYEMVKFHHFTTPFTVDPITWIF